MKSNHDRLCVPRTPNPSPAVIAEQTARIRAAWSDAELLRRMGSGKAVPVDFEAALHVTEAGRRKSTISSLTF